MILSGNLSLDRAAHAAASSSMSVRLAELDQRRRAAATTVDALLASWRGDAATHFSSRWHEWDGAATDVVDALSALLSAIDLARRDLEASDAGSAGRGDQLVGRLG